jgi:hypothetical protein
MRASGFREAERPAVKLLPLGQQELQRGDRVLSAGPDRT